MLDNALRVPTVRALNSRKELVQVKPRNDDNGKLLWLGDREME